MNELVIIYLVISTTQIIPMLFIALCLLYGMPFPTISYILGHRAPVPRRQRNTGVGLVEQFLAVLDSDILDYVTRFYLLAFSMQIATMIIIILAILYDLPLPLMPNFSGILPKATVKELLKFSVTTTVIQLIPSLLLVLGLVYEVPLPFMPPRQIHRTPPDSEITCYEQLSRDFASIQITRFKDSEKTVFFAKCCDDRDGTDFKLVLYQEKGVDARTECYLYNEIDLTLDDIAPSPISAIELEEIFSSGSN